MKNPSLPPGVSEYDAAHILSITRTCQTNRILSASSSSKANRMSAAHFVTWCRFHLNLPLLVVWRDQLPSPCSDCPADQCRAIHAVGRSGPADGEPPVMLLDHNGNHACSCTSQCGARYRTHNSVVHTLSRAARIAKTDPTTEPPTSGLLGNNYTPEQCASLFPRRKPSERDASIAATTKLLLDLLEIVTDPGERAIITTSLAQLALTMPTCGQGLRVDLSIVDHEGPSTDLWCDVACIHPTANMYMPQFLSALRAEQANDTVEVIRKPYSALPDSTAVANADKRKNTKYTPLM